MAMQATMIKKTWENNNEIIAFELQPANHQQEIRSMVSYSFSVSQVCRMFHCSNNDSKTKT